MVTAKNIIIFALICIAGVIAFFWFYQSDEAKIKKRFAAIAEETAKQSGEKELTAALKAKKITDMFAPSCRIDIPSESISRTLSKGDISSHVLAARARYSAISLEFYDIQVEFPKDGIADLSLTASLEAKLTSGELINEIHELRCILDKVEKEWFLSGIEEVDVLEK